MKSRIWMTLMAAPAVAAIISGTASEYRSGRVLARTRVTVESTFGSSRNVTQSVWADSTGQFRFTGLPAGAYLLRGERRGFATARFGEKPSARSGTPIVLNDGGSFSADLRLRKLGVITGEVQDENRVGLAEFQVTAYRAGKPPRFAASGYTDDRGVFRISGLEPGLYYVRSEARELEGRDALLATYFGQVLRVAEARIVNVALDEEVSGIRLEPIPGRLSSLDGVLIGPVAADLTLQTDAGPRTARAVPGGSFHFPELAPGSYDLLAQSIDQAHVWSASLRVVLGAGREQVSLQLAPSPIVQLRCEVRSGTLMEGVSAFLRRSEPLDNNPRRLLCGESATLSPGRWEIAAATPPSLYVSSYGNARSGENAYEFSLSPGERHELTVLLKPSPASLSGRVLEDAGQPAAGVPVSLYPVDAELRARVGGVRSTRSNEDGRFQFAGLAPGRYEALSSFSLEDMREAAWPAGQGKTVDLDESGVTSVILRLKDLP
ncbi:MAG: carboxypeptidase-like regulatory domain-containing protein [Acidobacteriales bacterium]|nr:carboxypeptidase-like regulatory domain-containing protein [Terriglobales bacterium]